MELHEIMGEFSRHVERLEAENRELRRQVAALLEKRKKYGQLADMPDILNAAEVAAFLRMQTKTVYEYLRKDPQAGGIPSFGGGNTRRALRCCKSDLIEWIEKEKRRNQQEDEEEQTFPTIVKGARRKKIA